MSQAAQRHQTTTAHPHAGATMRAIRQEVLGGPDVLELREVPRPEPGPTEVLVRVAAAGVNPLDWKTRTRGGFLGSPPFTVGADVAGVVAALGSGRTRFAVGDCVFGMPYFPGEAAALPMAALTAWQALVETADIQAGQRVFITGAAGGIGHLAVQIAKTRGAYVIGAARAAKHALLAQLGADETIDCTKQKLESVAGEIDVVLDLAGGQIPLRALPTLRDGGLLIAATSGGDLASEPAGDRVRVTYILVEPDRAGLEAIAELADSGRLRVHVAQNFPLRRPRGHTSSARPDRPRASSCSLSTDPQALRPSCDHRHPTVDEQSSEHDPDPSHNRALRREVA